ncbi:hypothetical protein ACEYW6_36435 [Nostoc sp. UIC 10607]|uniref:hypothetical protein n=1 Tax=Nostoc sp. UIC 10607 TaxID=3045935 RepID=UPI00399FD01D
MVRRIFAFAIHRFMLEGEPALGCQLFLLFIPLYGLMASRYRRDDAVTVAPTERDFSLEIFLEITLMVIQLSSERD